MIFCALVLAADMLAGLLLRRAPRWKMERRKDSLAVHGGGMRLVRKSGLGGLEEEEGRSYMARLID